MIGTQHTRKCSLTALALSACLAGTALLAVAPTATAHHAPAAVYDPLDIEFRRTHPLKVFVDVQTLDRRHGRTSGPADYAVRHYLDYALPDYIVMVTERHHADMVVRADLIDYDLHFRITDIDRRNKKYKKSRRYLPGRCGYHQRGLYTRVTERGTARADFELSVTLRGVGHHSGRVHIRADESYRYGKDLVAITNCGAVPSHHAPNSTVERLLHRADGSYRPVVAQEIREEAVKKLSRVIADRVRGRAEQYYVHLAERGFEPGHQRRRPGHQGYSTAPHGRWLAASTARPDMYDFDHVGPDGSAQEYQGEWRD